MITNEDIGLIHSYVEGEILLAFGSDIFSKNSPAISEVEEKGIIYLTNLLDETPTEQFLSGSPADYLQGTIKVTMDEPLRIFPSDQKQRLVASLKEIKNYMQKEIYKFLQEYQERRIGLDSSKELNYFLPKWFKTNSDIEFKLKEKELRQEIQSHEDILKKLIIAHQGKIRFLRKLFLFGTFILLGGIGAMFQNFLIPQLLFTTNNWLIVCMLLSASGLVGAITTINSQDFQVWENLVQQLPNNLRELPYSSEIFQHLTNEMDDLKIQLQQLQDTQNSVAQIMQALPQKKPVMTVSTVVQRKAIPTHSEEPRANNSQSMIENEEIDYLQPQP